MSALLELAEECERIVVPSRELDLAIARQFDTTVLKRNHDDTANYVTTNWHYTASIDAAMSLVPENWRIAEVGETIVACCDPWAVRLFERCKHDRDSQKSRGDAATFPLALCAAALRARAAA